MIALTTMPIKSMTIRRALLLAAALLAPSLLMAQTTLVSGTVVDSGGVAWKNGTYQFTFFPSPANPTAQYTQGGLPFSSFQTVPANGPGQLDNTGSFANVAVPDNLTIFPSGSDWELQVCPAATASNGCFIAELTVTGTSQNVTSSLIPPAIVVNLTNPQPAGASAYIDGEISGARVGSTYFNLTDGTIHVCQIPLCTWVSTNSFKGPIPWVDVTAGFGARTFQVPASTITVTSPGSSPTVTTTGVADFIVNDGIVIPTAGAATTQTTPSAPSVTVIGTTGGSATINYQCVGVDKQWGLTSASAAGTTSTAPAVFGNAAVGISTISRNTNVVSVTSSATMPFSSGTFHAVIANVTGGSTQFSGLQLVTVTSGTTLSYSQTGANESGTVGAGSYILFKNAFIITQVQATAGSNQIVLTTDVNHNIQFRNSGSRPVKIFLDGIQFASALPQGYANGLFGVAGVTANTITITTEYTSPITVTATANSAYATSTVAQMTATVYPVIDVTCPVISGTTKYYAVYGNYGSGYAPLGFTTWGKNIFEDYGPAFTQTGFIAPPAMNLPGTPPASAQNQAFTGQIQSINGSTLTLTGNVTNAVNGLTAYHDNGLPFQKALAAACANLGESGGGSNTSGFAPVYFPRQPLGGSFWYLFNAPVDVSATCNRVLVVDGGRVYLDGTIYGDNAGLFEWKRPEDVSGFENISTGNNSGRQVYIFGHASPEMVSSANGMRISGMQFNTLSNGQNALVVQGSNTAITDSAFITNATLGVASVPLVYSNAGFANHLTNISWSGNVNFMYPVTQSGSPPLGEVAYWPVPVIDIVGPTIPYILMDGLNYAVNRGIQMDNLYGNTASPPYFQISDVDTYQAPFTPVFTSYGNGGSVPQQLDIKKSITDSVIQPDVSCVSSDSGRCFQVYTAVAVQTAGSTTPTYTGAASSNVYEVLTPGWSPAQNTNECSQSTTGFSCTLPFVSNTYGTGTNCAANSASPAACGSAAAGAFVIPTTTTSYTVNTTVVTTHSRILLTPLSFASDLPSAPTCVAPAITAEPTISAVSAGVSFTITEASTTGQTCWEYLIVN